MKILKKIAIICAWILVGVAALLAILNIGVTVMYADFFRNSDSAFHIPGLGDGFVPQGFEYLQSENVYLIGGYQKDHSASCIYVQKDGGDATRVQLSNSDGSDYTGHLGGVAVNGDFLYVPGESGIDVFSLTDVLGGEKAAKIGTIPMQYEGDFVTFFDGYLLVGDFYYPEVYETPLDHRVTTPAGDENVAVIAIYQADASQEFGIAPHPIAAISIRDKVQGVGITDDGKIVLSTSYGLASSQLWFYTVDTQRVGTVTLDGQEVPLIYLDSANLTQTATLPPMSEELVCRDGKVYVLFESACAKYFFGNLIRCDRVYAYQPS